MRNILLCSAMAILQPVRVLLHARVEAALKSSGTHAHVLAEVSNCISGDSKGIYQEQECCRPSLHKGIETAPALRTVNATWRASCDQDTKLMRELSGRPLTGSCSDSFEGTVVSSVNCGKATGRLASRGLHWSCLARVVD